VSGSPSQRKKKPAAGKPRPSAAGDTPGSAVPTAPAAARPVGARFPHGPTSQQATPSAGAKGDERESIYGGRPVGARFHSQAPTSKAAAPRKGRWRLRNWRLRSRLVILLVIPLILAGVLGGLRIASSVGDIQDIASVSREVAVSQRVASVIEALQTERHLTAAATASEAPDRRALVEQQIPESDAAVAALLEFESDPANLESIPAAAFQDLLDRLGSLAAIRERVLVPGTRVDLAIVRYNEVIGGLLRFNRLALAGNLTTSTDLATGISYLAEAKEELSVQHAILLAGTMVNELTPAQESRLRGTEAAFDSAMRNFSETVLSGERQIYFSTYRGAAITDRENLLLMGLGDWPSPPPLNTLTTSWNDTATTVGDMLLTIETSLTEDLAAAAEAASDAAITDTIRDASIVATLLLLTLLLLVLVARSVLRPLLALRTSALDVAQRRLPALVEQLRRPGGWKDKVASVPLTVHTGEDIGQVARAFDEVHREAVRLATEQAMMRSTVNDMFVNLSRRSQSMVERQLRIIDALESGERDPEALGELFRLDHLATRMRRNNENLLVLAGSETRQRVGGSRPVLDVMRGAISEIEEYQRITIESVPDTAVRGVAVNDLVHLTAELLDNATNFSPKQAQVVLASSLQPDGSLLIEIRDSGVGMSATQRNAINDRLAVPPMVDVSVSRHMGLFVVGRLASRHGISVVMQPSGPDGGLTAAVTVPSALVSAEMERPAAPARAPQPAANLPAATSGTGAMFDAGRDESVAAAGTAAKAPARTPVAPGPKVPVATGPRAPQSTGSSGELPRRGEAVPIGNGSVSHGAGSNGTGNGTPFDAAVTEALGFSLGTSGGSDPAPGMFSATAASRVQTGAPLASGAPVASSSPEPGEGTPIFQEMRSAWFRQKPGHSAADSDGDNDQAPDSDGSSAPDWDPADVPDFGSSADEGWEAAEQLLTPVDAGTTRAGLPRRRPRAHLVPGGTGAARPAADTSAPGGRLNNVTLLRDAERVRGNLSSYQRGTRRGRHSSPMEDSDRSAGDQTPSDAGRHGEFPSSQERQ